LNKGGVGVEKDKILLGVSNEEAVEAPNGPLMVVALEHEDVPLYQGVHSVRIGFHPLGYHCTQKVVPCQAIAQQ
jgi:hypothetical protein